MNFTNLKIIYRDFAKNKLFSIIKVGGFALGIATCFLIALYIKHELSFDKHYQNSERIYRVVKVKNDNGEIQKGTCLQAPFAKTIEQEFPEIEKAGRICGARLFGAGSSQVRTVESTTSYYEDGFVFADQSWVEIMSLPFISGDPEEALTNPNSIVITESMARKLFADEDPLGESLILNNNNTFRVTAVIDDFSENSHVKFNFLMALYPNIFGQENCWGCNNHETYILAKPNTDIASLEKKLDYILEHYKVPYDKRLGIPNAERTLEIFSYELQPLKDIHLRSSDIYFNSSHNSAVLGDIRIIWILGIAALFVLIIASINFINLSTAKATHRSKEIGLKKAIGAKRTILVRNFFYESFLYSFISVILAVGISILLLPYFNHLSGENLVLPFKEWWFIPLLFSITAIIGGLAGIYPSFYLTSFKPVKALKGENSKGVKSSSLRNGLVVFQFAASVVLIISALVIYRQMNFILNKELGFNKEQVLILHGTNATGDKIYAFQEEIESLSEVSSTSITSYLPIANTRRNGNCFYNDGMQRIDNCTPGQNWAIDEGYIETMGLDLVQGRNFSKQISTDRGQACIINQEMARQLGLENPVGKRIWNGGSREIIGVVKDFNFNAVTEEVSPLMMRMGNNTQMMSIRTSTADMTGTLKSVTQLWNEFSPKQSIRYSFLDKEFSIMYDNVLRLGKIFWCFALLAIIVACLGLYGLAMFITKERIKEIGVRKVNGATIVEILATLNKSFLAWVIIAIVFACPIAWYAMSKWLDTFAYRIDIEWWVFILAGIGSVLVAFLTVSYQSWWAARKNPVEALRYE